MRRRDAEPRGNFGVVWIASERFPQLRSKLWQFVGFASDLCHVAFAVDDHDVADHARLVAMRGRIAEIDLRHDARLARVGNIDDAGAQSLLVRQVTKVRIIAVDVYLLRPADRDALSV